MFLTPKIYLEHLKGLLGRSILHYYHFLQYLGNYLGQLINLKYIRKYLNNYLGQLINFKYIRNI